MASSPPPPAPLAAATVSLDARAPPSLRHLLTLFSSIEFSLSSLALYQRTADWDAVKLAVESSCQSTLTKDHLQQILWLLPTAYSVAWSRRPVSRKRARAANSDADDRDPEEPLLVLRRARLTPATTTTDTDTESDATAVTSETMAERIAVFATRLNKFIHDEATKLTQNTPSKTWSDEEISQALEEVKVGRAALPEREMLSAQQHAQQRLRAIAKKNALAVTSAEMQAALAAPVPEDLQTLPKWLIDKVRRQEQQSKKVSQRSDQAQRQRLFATLPQLSDQVHSLALVQRKHVFPLKEMARQLVIKAPIKDQIEEQIHLLEEMVPFWITVFSSDGAEYVKLAKTHKFNAVKAALRVAVAAAVKSNPLMTDRADSL